MIEEKKHAITTFVAVGCALVGAYFGIIVSISCFFAGGALCNLILHNK
jgi:hypothetical protein